MDLILFSVNFPPESHFPFLNFRIGIPPNSRFASIAISLGGLPSKHSVKILCTINEAFLSITALPGVFPEIYPKGRLAPLIMPRFNASIYLSATLREASSLSKTALATLMRFIYSPSGVWSKLGPFVYIRDIL